MKFGFFAMPEHFPWSNWNLAYDLDLEKAKIAERLGYDEFWWGEHHAGGYEPVPVPEYYIARASAVTSRIRLGTGTVNLPYHDPFQVAERLAFLDQLTHGRLIYGLGGGGLPFDQELFGTFATAGPRFDESLAVVRELWRAEKPISHDGEFWQFEDRQIQVRPYQEEVPIAIAGLRSPGKYTLCGEEGFMPMSMYYVKPERKPGNDALSLQDQIGAAIAGAKAAGRDVDEPRRNWKVLREVYVSDSRDAAIRDLKESWRFSDYIYATLGAGEMIKDTADRTPEEMDLEWLIDELPMIIGSPEDCIRQIRELEEQTGGFGTLIINDRNWVTMDRWTRSAELFARYVAPAFLAREGQPRRRGLVDNALSRSDMWPTKWWTERPQ